LIPILDKEVKGLLRPPKGKFWVTMHDQLSDESRRRTITDVCDCAPDSISLLRRIDVALWMHATRKKRRQCSLCRTRQLRPLRSRRAELRSDPGHRLTHCAGRWCVVVLTCRRGCLRSAHERERQRREATVT